MAKVELGHRLIMPDPDTDGGEFDEGEVIGVMLFRSGWQLP
jgi:hypothetical protein